MLMHRLITKIIYTGTVVTLATHKQKKAVFGITNRAAVKLIENQVRPGDPKLQEITGAQEPSGIPIAVEAEKPSRNDRKPGSRSRSNDRGNRDGNFKSRSSGGGRFETPAKTEVSETSIDRRPTTERSDRPFRATPKKWEDKARESRTREDSSTTAGNRGRVETTAPARAAKKAPRMPLEKRIALEKAESRARSGKTGAPKKFVKAGGKPFKAGKPSQAKRG
jgi:hypothetical protein